jgi:hypothetical protein
MLLAERLISIGRTANLLLPKEAHGRKLDAMILVNWKRADSREFILQFVDS